MGGTPPARVRLSTLADGHPDLARLVEAIVDGDRATFRAPLTAQPELAVARVQAGATRADAEHYFFPEIAHYVYAGDSALHMAAAAHAPDFVGELGRAGADVGAANRRAAKEQQAQFLRILEAHDALKG